MLTIIIKVSRQFFLFELLFPPPTPKLMQRQVFIIGLFVRRVVNTGRWTIGLRTSYRFLPPPKRSPLRVRTGFSSSNAFMGQEVLGMEKQREKIPPSRNPGEPEHTS